MCDDVVDRQLAAELLGQILFDVLLVLPRQDHFGDAVAARGQHLFLDARRPAAPGRTA